LDIKGLGSAEAQAVSHLFSPWMPGLALGLVHVKYVVEKVALGQGFSEFFGFTLSLSFHRCSPCSCITCGMNSKPVIGRISKTHPIDVNNMNTGSKL
jgi:hypothetical protein